MTVLKHGHEHQAATKLGLKDGDNSVFESKIMVVIDDLNALVDKAYKYVGLRENQTAKEG